MPTLKWIGKDRVINYHNEVPLRLFKENSNLSVNSNNTKNLLIEGDNLEALKARNCSRGSLVGDHAIRLETSIGPPKDILLIVH